MNTTVFCKKNKVVIILVAIILIIPTFLAIHFNLNLNLSGKHLDKSTSVMITTPTGELFSVENESEIRLFSDIVTFQRTNIDETSRDFDNEKPFKVEFIKESGERETYEFYMENTVDGCVFKDSDGLFYLINNDKAITLLKKQEFSSVNGNTVVPYALITKENGVLTELTPVSGTWSFLEANGEYKTETLSENVADALLPEIRISLSDIGSLSFLSSEPASNTTVTLSQNGIVKHEGKYENLLNANVMSENDAYYNLEIKAEWEKSDSRGYYGEVVYKAKLLYDVAPTYELIYRGNVSKGDFTIIKMQNFNMSDTLYLQSDFPFPTELKVFESDKGYSFAFLPAAFTDAESGKYNITLTPTNGSSQTLSSTVKDGRKPATVSQNMLISDVNLQTAFTEEAVNEIKTIFAEKTASTESFPLWDGKFVYPDSENKGTVGKGMAHFGTKRSIMGLYQTQYIHEGIDIALNTGDNVLASNNGKVVFAGNTKLLGNLVIVDHGCSVFSYYGHLDTLLVKENDVVSKSGVIGKAGSTGFAVSFDGVGSVPTSQVHFAISVEGTFVNPYYFWKMGVSFDED